MMNSASRNSLLVDIECIQIDVLVIVAHEQTQARRVAVCNWGNTHTPRQ